MNNHYTPTDPMVWEGRISGSKDYLHEKVSLPDQFPTKLQEKSIVLLGYACDEGVRRNSGRVGAIEGPKAIKQQLAKMANHLAEPVTLVDAGTFHCNDGDMESAQKALSNSVSTILSNKCLPILLGGGHDIAYGHYTGIRNFVGSSKTIGIINFDAHFDLRTKVKEGNSGTPFYQIAQDCAAQGTSFEYLCLGIRKESNSPELFNTANKLGVDVISLQDFYKGDMEKIIQVLNAFLSKVDVIYLTIDLDGFSSAFAPGVSAPSPLGLSPEHVMPLLDTIIGSGKLISADIAEMNPRYDIDDQTARLAAGLVHYIIHKVVLL